MLNFLFTILIFIVAILILVGVHEYGHFIVARWCGVAVESFSLGMGPAICKRRARSGTLFQFAWFPIGGYVKLLDERAGPLPRHIRANAFNRQPVYKRTLILLAGPVFNFILAMLIYWAIYTIGFVQVLPRIGEITPGSVAAKAQLTANQVIVKINHHVVHGWEDVSDNLLDHIGAAKPVVILVKQPDGNLQQHRLFLQYWHLDARYPDVLTSIGITPYFPKIPVTIGQVMPDSPAAQVGLKVGDTIVAINGASVTDWQQMLDTLRPFAHQVVTLDIVRHDKSMTVKVILGARQENGQTVASLGVVSPSISWPADALYTVRDSPWQALLPAWQHTLANIKLTFDLLGKIFTGHLSWQGLSGPVGIAQGAAASASFGWMAFLTFLALVSVSLGVANLLPLPILDGGQLLLCLIEGATRRVIPDNWREMGMGFSILLLLILMLAASYNDILRAIT